MRARQAMDINRIGIATIANDSLPQKYLRITNMVMKTLGVEVSCGSIFNWLARNGFKRDKRDFYKQRETKGRFVDASGYVMVKTDKGWRREHTVLMERYLGRPLGMGEVVHHRNGDRSDDSRKNLLLCTRSELSSVFGGGYKGTVSSAYHRREMRAARKQG